MWKTSSLLFCFAVLAQVLRYQDAGAQNFTPDQLDNLLAPVALYPDPLLAQVLVAATFPDQIDEAARFVRANADPAAIDGQAWDVSVKAVAHYPDVLSMMADSLDWTSALGQAYVAQPDDVMASVQRLRQQAQAAGNLDTGPEQEVVDDGGDIEIWPAQPQVIYVPVYDPGVVYFGSGGALGSPIVTFGAACPIGAWLNRDFDWHHRRVFYHGWSNGPGWVGRARPYVQLNSAYVDSRFQKVATGRADPGRTINRVALDRFSSVHRNVRFSQAPTGAPPNGNKIIQRNIDTGDPRIETFRGRSAPPQNDAQVQTYRASRPPEAAPQPAPQEYHAPAPVFRPPVQQPEPSRSEAFGGNRGPFPAQAASQRGQQSRAMAPPAPRPAPPPAPASRAPEGRR